MTIREALDALKKIEAELQAYGHALGCLNYDGETVAPRNSAPMRGETMAYLSGIVHSRVTAEQTGEVVDTLLAGADGVSQEDARRARLLKKDRDMEILENNLH